MPLIETDGKKRDIGRVIGGIAWPGEKPGFAVVIGEERLPEIGGKNHHYYLLAEVEERDMGKLLEGCAELIGRFEVQALCGRPHKTSSDFLWLWSEEARGRGIRPFYVYDAPSVSEGGLIQYHINVLLEKLRPERKYLHGLEGSQVSKRLLEIPESENCYSYRHEIPRCGSLGIRNGISDDLPPVL